MTIFFGLLLGVTVGSVLGLIGAGGAILAVPGLVAALGLSATAATTSSTIIVGSAALVGALRRRKTGTVNVKVGLTFSAIGVLGTFLGTLLLRFIPENILLVLFAFLMFGSAYSMCCREVKESDTTKPNWFAVVVAATGVGILTGLLGIGGGFLIVPGLVASTGMPILNAIGSSLVAVAAFGLTTSANYALSSLVDWPLAVLFVVGGIFGGYAGTIISRRMAKTKGRLNIAFACLIFCVALYMIWRGIGTLMA